MCDHVLHGRTMTDVNSHMPGSRAHHYFFVQPRKSCTNSFPLGLFSSWFSAQLHHLNLTVTPASVVSNRSILICRQLQDIRCVTLYGTHTLKSNKSDVKVLVFGFSHVTMATDTTRLYLSAKCVCGLWQLHGSDRPDTGMTAIHSEHSWGPNTLTSGNHSSSTHKHTVTITAFQEEAFQIPSMY